MCAYTRVEARAWHTIPSSIDLYLIFCNRVTVQLPWTWSSSIQPGWLVQQLHGWGCLLSPTHSPTEEQTYKPILEFYLPQAWVICNSVNYWHKPRPHFQSQSDVQADRLPQRLNKVMNRTRDLVDLLFLLVSKNQTKQKNPNVFYGFHSETGRWSRHSHHRD